MKRSSGDMENITSMAKCLMLLSGGAETDMGMSTTRSSSQILGRVFECKTCNREFSSFQALGGHRASHKKTKLMEGELQQLSSTQLKPKTHECSICGLEFSIGQALGGHMRRHRASLNSGEVVSPPSNSSSSSPLDLFPQRVPVLKRSSSRRVLCLDLNLPPLENDLDIHVGTGFQEKNTPPMIHCFI